MLMPGHQNDHDDENVEKTASFKYNLDGFSIELNIYINIYNNNDNNNNLANQGGKAGVSFSATGGGQISGKSGTNVSQGGQIAKEVEPNVNQTGQMAKKERESNSEEGIVVEDSEIGDSGRNTDEDGDLRNFT
jgi:hypothetical protein